MKVTVIPIVFRPLGTVPKNLEKRLKEVEIIDKIDTIQTIALLRLVGILRNVLDTWDDQLSLELHWKSFFLSKRIQI